EIGILEGYSAVAGSGAAIRIEFDDPGDWQWALDMWRSLAPAWPTGPPARPPRLRAVEYPPDLVEAACQLVDVVGRRVDAEAGPGRRGQIEPLVERHRAVMAGPHRDAVAVEDLGDLVRMDARQVERHDTAAAIR